MSGIDLTRGRGKVEGAFGVTTGSPRQSGRRAEAVLRSERS